MQITVQMSSGAFLGQGNTATLAELLGVAFLWNRGIV